MRDIGLSMRNGLTVDFQIIGVRVGGVLRSDDGYLSDDLVANGIGGVSSGVVVR